MMPESIHLCKNVKFYLNYLIVYYVCQALLSLTHSLNVDILGVTIIIDSVHKLMKRVTGGPIISDSFF
jgi:hypothetical protein